MQPITQRAARLRDALAQVLPLLVAGSGLWNLTALLGGPAPTEVPEWLRAAFPLDFVGAGRWEALLLGFSMLLAAIHLWGRKRRALALSATLAFASGVFHLTRDWDLEKAACSLGIALLLLAFRRAFPFGSGRPPLALALRRAAAALVIAGAYGVAGFWLLEPREFGRNFHWWEAAADTIRVMLFAGDPMLIPRTAYAAWFLDSLYLMSAAAFLYCGFTLFRPVAYRFRRDESGRERARQITAEHGRSGQDFFKFGPDKSFFFLSSGRSYVAYRVANGVALVLGGPVGPEDEMEETVRQFVAFCQRRGWRIGFHQVPAGHLQNFRRLGFQWLRIGDDAVVDLERFSLEGSAMKEFRNTVRRVDRLGYSVERIDPPVSAGVLAAIEEVSREWLSLPGHRERRFTLGRFEAGYVKSTTVYLARDGEGRAAAFINLIPSYRQDLATVDLMRRRRDAPNGIMDYLFAKAFLDLKARGITRFSLGMAPLGGAGGGEPERPEERLVEWSLRRFPSLFRADSLRRFKAKYASHWEPRYEVYRSRWDLPRIALALRGVSEIGEEALEGARSAA